MSTPVEVSADGLLAGRYRLTERIAGGGMGEVWRADDVLLGRVVAVKTLRAEYVDDEDFRARFRAEARHAGRLSHPGIASVYDFGELADRAWLVMELVDGEPLSGLLRREGALTPERALDVVGQTAAALQAAHDGGVVHRDVKPGNLLIRPDGVVKVTDFGIASAADAAPLTRTGQVVGTPYYLAPEQVAGGSGSPATDLYALGVVAYEALAGARPFPGDSPIAVAMAHLQTPAPALPATVPAPVQSLVSRLLSKDPADRPATASAVAHEAAALRAALTGGEVAGGGLASLPVDPPVAARPEGAEDATRSLPAPAAAAAAAQPAGRSRRTQRWAVSAVALLLGLLALGLGLRGPDAAPRTAVPAVAVGAPEATARAALEAAGLQVDREVQASARVPKGRVVAVRPGSGTRVEPGSAVTLVVSSGPPPVRVSAAELVGQQAAAARALLQARGLAPRLAYDGRGTPVGTVSSVAPVGDVPVGSRVVLHVVPAPSPAPRTTAGTTGPAAPAPTTTTTTEPAPAAEAPAKETAKGTARGGGTKAGGKGQGKGKG